MAWLGIVSSARLLAAGSIPAFLAVAAVLAVALFVVPSAAFAPAVGTVVDSASLASEPVAFVVSPGSMLMAVNAAALTPVSMLMVVPVVAPVAPESLL